MPLGQQQKITAACRLDSCSSSNSSSMLAGKQLDSTPAQLMLHEQCTVAGKPFFVAGNSAPATTHKPVAKKQCKLGKLAH
jgi:hypothetical protein